MAVARVGGRADEPAAQRVESKSHEHVQKHDVDQRGQQRHGGQAKTDALAGVLVPVGGALQAGHDGQRPEEEQEAGGRP
ncbi:MAG: hypothetical protein MK118_09500, partial [Dehalococcoidia bacterium]|nr:hypothetical protein [Dehalococcoidia bacterium]